MKTETRCQPAYVDILLNYLVLAKFVLRKYVRQTILHLSSEIKTFSQLSV